MITYDKINPAGIRRLKEAFVSIVYLFGSHAEGAEHGDSDVDIGVVFNDSGLLERDANRIYVELYDIFTDHFKEKRVDIVFLQRAGLELCFDAINNGRILYESSVEDRLDFEEDVFRGYIDFRPLLNQFDQAFLKR